jgi:hypothetical protein
MAVPQISWRRSSAEYVAGNSLLITLIISLAIMRRCNAPVLLLSQNGKNNASHLRIFVSMLRIQRSHSSGQIRML